MSYEYYPSILKLVVVVFCLIVLLFDDALACRYKITKKYRMLMFILKGSIELGRGGDRAWRATECTWRHQKKLSSYVKTKHQTKPGNNNVLTLLRASSSIKREKQQQKKVNQPNCCCLCRWSKISVPWWLQWTSYRRTRKRQVGRCLTSLSKAGKSGAAAFKKQVIYRTRREETSRNTRIIQTILCWPWKPMNMSTRMISPW